MAEESNQMTPDGDASPIEIRAQIEQTRAEMSQTIDAIQARLSPSRLAADAKQSVKDATVGRAKRLATTVNDAIHNGHGTSVNVDRAIDAVKANPVPFAVAGAAATALLLRAVMRSRTSSRRRALRQDRASADVPRARATRLARNRAGVLIGACAAGLACWGASRANIDAMMPQSVLPPSM